MKLINNFIAITLITFCVILGGCAGGGSDSSSSASNFSAPAQPKLPFEIKVLPDNVGPSGFVERPASYVYVMTATVTATEDFSLLEATVTTSEKTSAVQISFDGTSVPGIAYSFSDVHTVMPQPGFPVLCSLKKGTGTKLDFYVDMNDLDGKVITISLTKITWVNDKGEQFTSSVSGISLDVLAEALPDTRAFALMPLVNTYGSRGLASMASIRFENLSNTDDADITQMNITLDTTVTADLPSTVYLAQNGRVIAFAYTMSNWQPVAGKTMMILSIRPGDLHVQNSGSEDVEILGDFTGTGQRSYTLNVVGVDSFDSQTQQGMGSNGIVDNHNGRPIDFVTNFP